MRNIDLTTLISAFNKSRGNRIKSATFHPDIKLRVYAQHLNTSLHTKERTHVFILVEFYIVITRLE